MLREAAYDPRRLDEYLDQIDRIDPARLQQYEEATGIALARAHVDFSAFQQANFEAEERRLMPEYVARQFLAAAKEIGLRVERRADGLWRVPHVLQDLRSERLDAVRRLGKPETSYRKVTFEKKHLEQDQHLDAVLTGPGHSLYAAVDERLNERLAPLRGGTAVFVDATAVASYWIHFLEMEIRGEGGHPVHAELLAVAEQGAKYELVSPDVLHDLAPYPGTPEGAPMATVEPQRAIDFVKAGHQLERRLQAQEERQHYAQVAREYLEESFQARIRAIENRVMRLRAREASGETEVALARQQAERDLEDLQRARRSRLTGLDRLAIARSGPLRHLATAWVLPPDQVPEVRTIWPEDAETRRRVELAAMRVVVEYERRRGWETFDISVERGRGSTSAPWARPIWLPAGVRCVASRSRGGRGASRCG